MKPLLLALLALSLLVGAKLNAQVNLQYYQYSKTQSYDVGVQPHFIYYDKITQKVHVFCIGQDLNYDGIKDDIDVSPSWWTIEMTNGGKTTKSQDFAFGSFNMFYFRPAIDAANRRIYIPSTNKVYNYGLDDMVLSDSIVAPNVIEGMTCGNGSLYLSVNPVYGEAGKVLVYTGWVLSKEIPVGVTAQNIAVYSNSKTQKAIAVVNIGSYGGQSSVSFIEFDDKDEYTKTDVEIGITANSIYYNDGYIYVICNSTNNTYKINAENYKIEKILHSGTAGWDGPRQMAFNNKYGFISDFSGDVRLMDLDKGVKDIIHIGGKIEGISMISDSSFITALQMKADYSSNNSVLIFEKKTYKFDADHPKSNMYDFCETCENPQVIVSGNIEDEKYVLCVGDSTKGILPSISRISVAWPTTQSGNSINSFMDSREIYKFSSYVFKNPPTMSLTDKILYVSTDKKIMIFHIDDKAQLIGELDFPSAFYLKSGKYYEKDYVIGLNKEGSIIVIGDETNIKMSNKPLIDGAMINDFANGDVSSAIVYDIDNKADLELKHNEDNLYTSAVGLDGRIFTDNDFQRVFYMNFTDISSEIQEFGLSTMKLETTFNSGLVSNKSSRGIYSPATIDIPGNSNTEAIVITSELEDIRLIDLASGSLTTVIPMPAEPKCYIGNERYFYTLLPKLNLVCMYGLVSGAVEENNNSKNMSFKIYPNPANAFTNIELGQDYGKAKMELLSLTGEIIYSTEFYGGKVTLNLNDLNIISGYYNIAITSEDKKGIQPLILIK